MFLITNQPGYNLSDFNHKIFEGQYGDGDLSCRCCVVFCFGSVIFSSWRFFVSFFVYCFNLSHLSQTISHSILQSHCIILDYFSLISVKFSIKPFFFVTPSNARSQVFKSTSICYFLFLFSKNHQSFKIQFNF